MKILYAPRAQFLDAPHNSAFRLFNGHYEGTGDVVLDVYGNTLIVFTGGDILPGNEAITDIYIPVLERLPWIERVIHKPHSRDRTDPGRVIYGDTPTACIIEHGITYAIDLLLNQDASFYLDTRNLRRWLLDNSQGARVLNTFAYTGSLGVASLAGGADHVTQLDLNKKFLALARSSGMLNRLDIGRMKLVSADFFDQVARYKRDNQRFDIAIVDAPFFSATGKGTIDLAKDSVRLINKVRPLIDDNGYLVAINNALYLPGNEYHRSLTELCQDGYLSIDNLIPVPPDVTGYPETIARQPPVDPGPFNHPTKIAVLRVRRKK